MAGLDGEMTTTEAMLTPEPFAVTRPLMLPTVERYAAVGYNSEIPATSSGPSGAAFVAALVMAVDITAEVKVCCRPSVWPNSCTIVVKKNSLELGQGLLEQAVAGRLISLWIRMVERRMGTNWPLLGPAYVMG